MDKITELVKLGKIREISDMRDETDLNGFKLTIDLKRGVDADKLMAKLFKATPLEDSFSCNFNILVSGQPRVMGVREILQEWTAFRVECVRRRTYYDLHGKEKRLHLLQGLAAILLDIDKAIKIIRTTEEESEVVPNLMIGFGIDEVQADYVAEIKLRHLNREYILKRTGEIEQLEKDIADLNDVLAKPARVRRIIINELNEVAKKYAQPRRSEILYDLPEEEAAAEEEAVPDYPVTVFFTREGYLKKIPPQSLRTAGAHKLKEGDEIVRQVETRNNVEALFFTDKQQVYKVRLAELEDGKVAQMGIYLPGRLGMDEGRTSSTWSSPGITAVLCCSSLPAASAPRSPFSSYATKQNRRKLLKAYCDKEPLADHLLPARGDGAGHPHQRQTDASGRHGADRRKDHPRQSGRGGRDPEKEPDHRLRRPGGHAGTGEPPPLPRPQPAGHRCARPRRGRRGADELAVRRRKCRTST